MVQLGFSWWQNSSTFLSLTFTWYNYRFCVVYYSFEISPRNFSSVPSNFLFSLFFLSYNHWRHWFFIAGVIKRAHKINIYIIYWSLVVSYRSIVFADTASFIKKIRIRTHVIGTDAILLFKSIDLLLILEGVIPTERTSPIFLTWNRAPLTPHIGTVTSCEGAHYQYVPPSF